MKKRKQKNPSQMSKDSHAVVMLLPDNWNYTLYTDGDGPVNALAAQTKVLSDPNIVPLDFRCDAETVQENRNVLEALQEVGALKLIQKSHEDQALISTSLGTVTTSETLCGLVLPNYKKSGDNALVELRADIIKNYERKYYVNPKSWSTSLSTVLSGSSGSISANPLTVTFITDAPLSSVSVLQTLLRECGIATAPTFTVSGKPYFFVRLDVVSAIQHIAKLLTNDTEAEDETEAELLADISKVRNLLFTMLFKMVNRVVNKWLADDNEESVSRSNGSAWGTLNSFLDTVAYHAYSSSGTTLLRIILCENSEITTHTVDAPIDEWKQALAKCIVSRRGSYINRCTLLDTMVGVAILPNDFDEADDCKRICDTTGNPPKPYCDWLGAIHRLPVFLIRAVS